MILIHTHRVIVSREQEVGVSGHLPLPGGYKLTEQERFPQGQNILHVGNEFVSVPNISTQL